MSGGTELVETSDAATAIGANGADGRAAPAGLSRAEVAKRRAEGLGNSAPPSTTRTYLQIVRQNNFTFINTVLYATSLALIVMGLWGDAAATAGLVMLNVLIAVAQEMRAKRTLDRITLLTRPRVTAIREGQEELVDASELVVGDLVAVQPGDQIVTDGALVGERRIDVDESLLTGESEPVSKRTGDPVYSGSFCVAGSGYYETRTVGRESLANRLTAGARAFRQEKTPLQNEIDLIIRVMVLVVVLVGGPVMIDLGVRVIDFAVLAFSEPFSDAFDHAYAGITTRETVRAAAVVVAIVPQGLALMIVVTYAAAAVRLAGKGALVQQANAIESLSHVDVLCLDKTGTLTTNNLIFVEAHPIGIDAGVLGLLLGDAVACASDGNRTSAAIAAAFPGRKRSLSDEVPFTSARKWSAVAFAEGERPGCIVLGAPEIVVPGLRDQSKLAAIVEEWATGGKRVLLAAHSPGTTLRRDAEGDAVLPDDLEPIGLLAFVDELRPEARETLHRFAELGVRLKLISGDDPRTVAALAAQAEFPERIVPIFGPDLESMDDEAFANAARKGTIFGRTTPQQKERLVRVLRAQGNYVAMTGDGVNDVLAMKQANLAIAVRSGSPATRGVADLVLLEDSFAVLPPAFAEGQRILGGMRDVVGLFLARSVAVTLLIVGATLAEAPFPLTPKHNSLLAFFALGVPTLALAAWAKPARAEDRLLRAIAPIVFAAVVTVAPVALIVYLSWWRVTDNIELSRTALTATLIGCGLLLILFTRPPSSYWVTGEADSSDRRPALVAGLMGIGFAAVLTIEPLRRAFEVTRLNASDYATIALVLFGWTWLVRTELRQRWYQRFFGIVGPDDHGRPD